MIGEKILNYHIDSLIGEGGVGTVFQATHTQLGRKVAIKALNPLLVNNEQVKQRFRQEATTLSNLQHINIITLYDYLENEKGLFLIMEYAQGEALDRFIKKCPIPEEQVRYYFSLILAGMEYAHKQGVIHRDIKPSNIIITQDASAKVLDFGIAKILKENKNNLTKPGAQLGTVMYMSPEQVQGKEIDQRTDIYSLGVTLFEMLTGKAPYDETQLTEFDVFNKIVNDPLPPLKQFNGAISERMQQLIDKATAKNPAERFQSCAEFKEALLKQEEVTGDTTTQNLRPTQVKATDAIARNTSAASQKQRKKNTHPKRVSYAPLYILIFVLVGLVGFVIYSEFMGDDAPKKGIADNRKNTTGKDQEVIKKDPKTGEDQNKTKEEDKEKDKEDEEKKKKIEAQEAIIDSLNSIKKHLQDTLKTIQRKRTDSLMRGLVVDGRLLEEDELAEGMTVEVTLVNNRSDVKFKDVVIAIKYFNAAGAELEEYVHKYGDLAKEPKVPVTFKIKRNIEAARFQCIRKSANPQDLSPPAQLDSLNQKIKKIAEEIKTAQEKKEEEN
ncbi:serine/threonine-protein kinase [uncultured Microscilla sp.]|uniref:serine/threonine protein kinase n=1 Tax=uncultured Microscilla sp. TaxID=432653 RepID=UPI0026382250|nr:serine/threonine-protein kinase [uncultured Microscilla sp.]